MDVLVIDIGGSHVKLAVANATARTRFESGPHLTPSHLVQRTKAATRGWSYERVSIGYPGTVGPGGPSAEPGNLGSGWVGFDFARALSCPVRIVNDAVLQALGAYDGGRMLFLGLGTGLGSALVTERVIVPLELGDLPCCDGRKLSERLGRNGLESSGISGWEAVLARAVAALKQAMIADYVVLGGGNAKHVNVLPSGARRGGNDDAISGGYRLWREVIEPHDHQQSSAFWRVVQ